MTKPKDLRGSTGVLLACAYIDVFSKEPTIQIRFNSTSKPETMARLSAWLSKASQWATESAQKDKHD